jgi:hypothetical protein
METISSGNLDEGHKMAEVCYNALEDSDYYPLYLLGFKKIW